MDAANHIPREKNSSTSLKQLNAMLTGTITPYFRYFHATANFMDTECLLILISGTRRVVRIHVEPIEVELDDDGAILITALQSALPGASGIYFKDIDDCKASVRFDGKKLLPPGDGWKDRKYFASLGYFLMLQYIL